MCNLLIFQNQASTELLAVLRGATYYMILYLPNYSLKNHAKSQREERYN